MATKTTPRPLPAYETGQIPQPGDQVLTFDGHRAEVLWTTPRMVHDHRKTPHEADPDDPELWSTLVRLPDGTTCRHTTLTLRLDEP